MNRLLGFVALPISRGLPRPWDFDRPEVAPALPPPPQKKALVKHVIFGLFFVELFKVSKSAPHLGRFQADDG